MKLKVVPELNIIFSTFKKDIEDVVKLIEYLETYFA